MTAFLVPLHVAANTKVLSATFVLAFVGLLTRVRVGVDFERTRP
jgi:hypothetical protein